MSAPCRGNSMRGTLADGDGLWLAPGPPATLQVGDVVAYRSGRLVMAHRIVDRDTDGFRTQGDGNWRRDAARLAPEQLLGIVTARERRGVRTPVVGGRRGRWRAGWLHGCAFFRWLLLTGLAPVYGMVRISRLGRLAWRPRVLAVRFTAAGGTLIKYIHQGQTVACWAAGEPRWICRKPYDLILSPPKP